jgi:hypothetical protein
MPGQAQAAWRTQRTPNPVLANGSLAAVACAGPAFCLAVGGYEDQFGAGHALAERWDGARWAVQPARDPATAVWTGLTGISCASAASCTAVGWYFTAAGRRVPIAERWNGARWAVQPVPSPSASLGSILSGVSCATPGSCTAVGQSIGKGGSVAALAARWNGDRWTLQQVPKRALGSELSGVSCPTATSCVAVGAAASATSQLTLAARWNGKTWVLGASPVPAGAKGAGFNGISCVSATSCVAVGDYGAPAIGGLPAALAETWNGTSWTINPVPGPISGVQESVLFAVWCSMPGTCAAVGGAAPDLQTEVPLAVASNGGGWSVRPAPDPADAVGAGLSGVACAAAADCHAVGASQVEIPLAAVSGQPVPGRTLAEAWRGTRWAIQASPNLGGAIGFSELTGISCTSPRACVAVGDYVTVGGAFAPFAEQWTGTRWLLRPVPEPRPAESFLNGVSCPSARDCTAVGYTTGVSGFIPLVERWDGTRWRVGPAPRPAAGTGTRLSGVSCTSGGACITVGDRDKDTAPVADRWDGTRWRALSIPVPGGATVVSLSGISCATARGCAAVGAFTSRSGSQLPLAESWNGSRWTIGTVASPSSVVLSGVTCAAPAACTAAGWTVLSDGRQQPAARRWNGRTWARQAVPAATPFGSWLNGVSCAGVSCTAVGGHLTADGGTVLLIEAWDGTRWRIAAAANPALAFDSVLNAVACTAPRACTAVGSDLVITNVTVTLAMARS